MYSSSRQESSAMCCNCQSSTNDHLCRNFEIEKILNHLLVDTGYLYLVLWKDYPTEDASWEPETNLMGCPELLFSYKKKHLPGTLFNGECRIRANTRGAPTASSDESQDTVRICHQTLQLLMKFSSAHSRRQRCDQLLVSCYTIDSFNTDELTLIARDSDIFVVLYYKQHNFGFIADFENKYDQDESIQLFFQKQLEFKLFCPRFVNNRSLEKHLAVAGMIVTLWKDYHRKEVSWPELTITAKTIRQLTKLNHLSNSQ